MKALACVVFQMQPLLVSVYHIMFSRLISVIMTLITVTCLGFLWGHLWGELWLDDVSRLSNLSRGRQDCWLQKSALMSRLLCDQFMSWIARNLDSVKLTFIMQPFMDIKLNQAMFVNHFFGFLFLFFNCSGKIKTFQIGKVWKRKREKRKIKK